MSEKTYFCAYYDNFEFRTRHGDGWTEDEIRTEYLSGSVFDPICIGRFDTREEARNALLGYNGRPMYCSSRELRWDVFWLLTGELSYVAEEIWTVGEDGEEEFNQDNGWFDIFIEPFPGDVEDDDDDQ